MIYTILTMVKWLSILLVALVLIIATGILLFLKFAPAFGGRPDAETLARIKASKHFNGKTFINIVPTHASTIEIENMAAADPSEDGHILWQFLFPPKGKNPSQPLVSHQLALADSDPHSGSALKEGEFIWLGHSTVLFRAEGKTLITDPVFHRASPVPLGGKPFAMTHSPRVADLPFIDVVLISHDHYDHLDHKAIKQLVQQNKAGHFYVPLGIKAHLIRWGVASDKITEFDWYEEITLSENNPTKLNPSNPALVGKSAQNKRQLTTNELRLVFTPTRHFSGRRITGHRTTLWGSWVAQSSELNVYFSGDGGYSSEFATIGERFGPFDIAFMEDGAYNERWRDVHMLPEESAQAGFDLKTKVLLPIHWGKFDLSTHHWREPVQRMKQAVANGNATMPDSLQIKLATPRIGEVFNLYHLPSEDWWETEEAVQIAKTKSVKSGA